MKHFCARIHLPLIPLAEKTRRDLNLRPMRLVSQLCHSARGKGLWPCVGPIFSATQYGKAKLLCSRIIRLKSWQKSFLLVELFYQQLIRILSSTFLTASSSSGVTLFSSHWRHAVMQGTSHLSQNVVTQNFQRTFTFTVATETNRKDRILTEFLFFLNTIRKEPTDDEL